MKIPLFTCERAQGNCTITVQQIFLAGNSVLFKALQGYLYEVNSKPHLVNRSSFYVNSLEQFKTPRQTFPIDNKFYSCRRCIGISISDARTVLAAVLKNASGTILLPKYFSFYFNRAIANIKLGDKIINFFSNIGG